MNARDRKRQERAVAVLRDQLAEHFPQDGPCGFCGDTILGQRHRVIDAIAGQIRAGEAPDVVADDFGVDLTGIILALAVSW